MALKSNRDQAQLNPQKLPEIPNFNQSLLYHQKSQKRKRKRRKKKKRKNLR